MSTLKVNAIQAASGGSVSITGLALDGTGIVSSSVEGDAQGQIKINGNNVDINALGSGVGGNCGLDFPISLTLYPFTFVL